MPARVCFVLGALCVALASCGGAADGPATSLGGVGPDGEALDALGSADVAGTADGSGKADSASTQDSGGDAPATADVSAPIDTGEQASDIGAEIAPADIGVDGSDDASDAADVAPAPCKADKACDDKNPCTFDSCDEQKGECKHAAYPTALKCDDGDPCTVGDACEKDLCAGAPKPCGDVDEPCISDVVCNPASGLCEAAHMADGVPCDDGDGCTLGDACSNGACKGDTGSCDDGNTCTTDTCDKGEGCVHTATNAPCDDGDPCTLGDMCGGEGCKGSPLFCSDGNPCTVDVCDAQKGVCTFTPAAEGAACEDANPCTVSETCVSATCVGKPASCDDTNPCTTDACDPALPGGCTHTPHAAPCDDGNACTNGDACAGGVCKGPSAVSCDDGNPCTTDSCSPTLGCVQVPISGGACDDGSGCTTGDTCAQGVCAGTAGACECEKDADCVAKDDGNLCNGTLKCDETASPSKCVLDPASVVACDPLLDSACEKGVCDPKSGTCSPQPVNEGGACNDGNPCSTSDICKGGDCLGTSVPQSACDDNNVCTVDLCDGLANPTSGCIHQPVLDGKACDDGNACTGPDACSGGLCASGPGKNCDDGLVCTTDSCDGATGACKHTYNGAACDDGNVCTTGDACAPDGSCVGKSASCDDGNACTSDACAPGAGCTSTKLPDGASCGAGKACIGSVCVDSVGCADGTRDGLGDISKYPNAAACAGKWEGKIGWSSSQKVCASGWHVCVPADNGNDAASLKKITFAEAVAFAGCYPYNAAQDNGSCKVCSGWCDNDDMAALGAACKKQKAGGGGGCLANGIDTAYGDTCLNPFKLPCRNNDGVITGVTCCRN